jgi:hypothetical protein
MLILSSNIQKEDNTMLPAGFIFIVFIAVIVGMVSDDE